MSSFVELARRALNSNITTAAAATVLITLNRHNQHDTSYDNRYLKSTAKCDVAHSPFRRWGAQSSGCNNDTNDKRDKIHFVKTRPADELHSTYRVNWNTVLGEGAYGRVYPARHVNTGEKVSVLRSV